MLKAPAYVLISLVFFILIGVGFAYSYFFYPNTHPFDCVIRAKTGKDCPTCGFSRSFSNYSHLQFDQGKKFNKLSWPVFLFFCAQFFFRGLIVFEFLIMKKTPRAAFIKIELIVSIFWFLLAFLPLVLNFY